MRQATGDALSQRPHGRLRRQQRRAESRGLIAAFYDLAPAVFRIALPVICLAQVTSTANRSIRDRMRYLKNAGHGEQ
jgi:hypothetical protein